MLEKQILPNGYIEIIAQGSFDAEGWQAYQDLVWEHLEASDHKCYFILNVTQLTSVDPKIIKEFGTARHLGHARLGMIAMLGTSALQNFLLKLTETNAMRNNSGQGIRIYTDRESAIRILDQRREMDEQISNIQADQSAHKAETQTTPKVDTQSAPKVEANPSPSNVEANQNAPK